MIIFVVLISMITIVYIKVYSSDQIYEYLDNTVSYTEDQCMAIYSTDGTPATSFYLADGKKDMACGKVGGNAQGSYLTMLSGGGLMFGIINIIVSTCLCNFSRFGSGHISSLISCSRQCRATLAQSSSTNHIGSQPSPRAPRVRQKATSSAGYAGSPSHSAWQPALGSPRRLSCSVSNILII